MIIKIAALSAALLLGTMSQAAFAQAPTAPAAQPGSASPAVKAPVGAPPKAVQAPAATKVGAKAPPPVNACKGLSDTDCGTKIEECSYVKAYKTKAGKTVAGYCKAKPKTKAKAAVKAVTPPATAVKPSAPAAKPPAPAPKN